MMHDLKIKEDFEKIRFNVTIETFRDLELMYLLCGSSTTALVEFANGQIDGSPIKKFTAEEIDSSKSFEFWKKLNKLYNLYQPDFDFTALTHEHFQQGKPEKPEKK